MSSIKSEPFAQECAKRKIFLKIPELTEKQLCVGVSFIIKMLNA